MVFFVPSYLAGERAKEKMSCWLYYAKVLPPSRSTDATVAVFCIRQCLLDDPHPTRFDSYMDTKADRATFDEEDANNDGFITWDEFSG